MKQNKQEKMKKSEKVADKVYNASDYKQHDEMSKGIAMTHEQVSDTYMEGTMERKKDRENL